MCGGNGGIFGGIWNRMVEHGGFVSEVQAELLKSCLMEWMEGIKGYGAISSNIKDSEKERGGYCGRVSRRRANT